ncbi:MAG: extracellular solute-binding protein [Alphaproteobacteria bacterium]|nr:extracellular solute-binding protein [Alphaproteobacteria bacterium]
MRRYLGGTVGAIAGVALAGTISTSAIAQTADPAAWAALQQRAKAEGQLVVTGPPFQGLRNAMVAAFKERFGIELNYLGLFAGEVIARVDTESKAGKVTIDANIGGTSTCWAMAARGQIENMNGKIIAPDVVAANAWRSGKVKLNEGGPVTDPNFRCSIQTAEWVMTDLFVNTSIVKPGEITSWKDLLKPQYKGKIAAFDPRRSGPGQTPVGYLAALFGQKYLTDLYIGQQVKLTADNRQLAEWVARGEFPIGIALVQFAVETYRKQGLPIERIYPADGQGSVTGGFSVVMMVKGAPNPAAAQLFVNWFASKEAQTIYETQMMETTMRTDVTGTNVPEYVRPKPGVAYPVDDYSYEHFSKIRSPAVEALSKELQR